MKKLQISEEENKTKEEIKKDDEKINFEEYSDIEDFEKKVKKKLKI
jgi:hypothetical protein